MKLETDLNKIKKLSEKIDQENCSICPIVFNVYEQLKDELWHSGDDEFADDQEDSFY